MITKDYKVLLLGIGNCGRADDGLGWAFLDKLKKKLPKNYDIEYRYQLQIEDAELASHYDKVYFIDAHKEKLKKGFIIEKCFPIETHYFTTHELSPETVLFLTNHIYKKKPKAYLIGMYGEEYSLKIGLTTTAQQNLTSAINSFNTMI
jgi:hydrogenase maturation protease